jgi:phospholipid/cholesterol/gamma-HCH transport system permease protein
VSAPAAAGEAARGAGPEPIATSVARVGALGVASVRSLGRLGRFSAAVAAALATRPARLRRALDELHDVGVLSVAIIAVSGLAVGMVLGLQGHNTLVRFGAEESLGAVVSLSLIRELGPVLSALLVTGRAASAAAAEIASMVVTEQLDGLRMMSIDPVHYVAAPKVVAFVVSMPLLSALFILLGLGGGYLVGVVLLGLDPGSYVSGVQETVELGEDVAPSLVKSVVFGALVGLIATYRGFHAAPHSAGVAAATTGTVVVASVTTLLVDYVLTALMGV